MKDKSTGDPATACQVIDEVGSAFLQNLFQRTPAAISFWKKKGLPQTIDMYLRNKYSNLKAFGGPGEPGISKNQ